eukprot:2183017-Amphidinium_carterae.1
MKGPIFDDLFHLFYWFSIFWGVSGGPNTRGAWKWHRLEEQIVERPVEIPVIHDQRNIVYKPVWVQPEVGGAVLSISYTIPPFLITGRSKTFWN